MFLGSCLVNVPSTSCLASAWCCCSSLCSGCSLAVQATCRPLFTKTDASSRSSRRHLRPVPLTLRRLQRTTPPGVLTNWPSSSRSENASRSCWCSFPSCTHFSTRRRSATRSSSSTRWITTGEEGPRRHLWLCSLYYIYTFIVLTKPHPVYRTHRPLTTFSVCFCCSFLPLIRMLCLCSDWV